MDVSREEWLRLMLELARLDRDAFREVRAEAWDRVTAAHGRKSQKQIAVWRSRAS